MYKQEDREGGRCEICHKHFTEEQMEEGALTLVTHLVADKVVESIACNVCYQDVDTEY